MNPFERSYYEMAFDSFCLRRHGEEFQSLFQQIMGLRFPGDFIATRPWGNVGDRKNDGYHPSRRMLFQVYAPQEMTASAAIEKINEDFTEAIEHWEDHFSTWVFVHNTETLGPPIIQHLLHLGTLHPTITVTHWGLLELRQRLFELAHADIARILGPAPSHRDFVGVRTTEIQEVINRISSQSWPTVSVAHRVPHDKLLLNGLSDAAKDLITMGLRGSEKVRTYFQNHHDPGLGDRVAESFREEYQRLRDESWSPDEVFAFLQAFAGGEAPAPPRQSVAVLVVLAFFFEECDIFERLRTELQQ